MCAERPALCVFWNRWMCDGEGPLDRVLMGPYRVQTGLLTFSFRERKVTIGDKAYKSVAANKTAWATYKQYSMVLQRELCLLRTTLFIIIVSSNITNKPIGNSYYVVWRRNLLFISSTRLMTSHVPISIRLHSKKIILTSFDYQLILRFGTTPKQMQIDLPMDWKILDWI